MITLEIGKPVVVTKEQYNYVMTQFSGICFGRITEEKEHLIKIGIPGKKQQYKKMVEDYLNKKTH